MGQYVVLMKDHSEGLKEMHDNTQPIARQDFCFPTLKPFPHPLYRLGIVMHLPETLRVVFHEHDVLSHRC